MSRSRRLPGLGALRAFEAAARHLSFSSAASELAVTPAAVSRQVRTLEEQLGIQLFWRNSRTVRLTREGETLFAAASKALDTVADAVEQIGGAGGPRMLTVTATGSFAAKWLVPRLDRFRERHSGIDVRIDVSDRLVDFARSEAQVGIRFGRGVYPGLRADLLSEELVFPVCSPRLMVGEHPLNRLDDLRHHTLIHVPWQMQGESWPDWRMWLMAAGVKGIDPTRGIYLNEFTIAIQAAIDGQGLALGESSLVANDLAKGFLVQPFDLSLKGSSHFAYYIVAPRATADRPLVKAFREWVLEEMRGDHEPRRP
jgi:LysR family glycine cleavage system transcriptional activator